MYLERRLKISINDEAELCKKHCSLGTDAINNYVQMIFTADV